MGNFDTNIMERPAKRPRLSPTNDSPPEETADWDLQAARAQNDLNLKSIFEGIFSKYSKDFTEKGDEIDLQTGEIIVDNGHLLGMHEEDDVNDETVQARLHEAARQERDDIESNTEDLQSGEENEELSEESDQDEVEQSEPDSEAGVGSSTDTAPDVGGRDANPVSSLDLLDQIDKFIAPSDPLWQAPELPVFSTPKAETRRVQGLPKLPHIHREPSPPGSGSLWAIPKLGRPFTEGKPRATPSKTQARAKRKHHSSPVAYDWSFAATPDEDDSDDPLQEFQPSPSVLKLKSRNIRGGNIQTPTRIFSPLSRKQLPSGDKTNLPGASPDQSATYTSQDQENHTMQKNNSQSHVASTKPYLLAYPSSSPRTEELSPKNTPRKPRKVFTLNETRQIVQMRYVQKMKWQEISDCLPGRTAESLIHWNLIHWTIRRENPPQLSAPWSPGELQALDRLKDQVGLSWSEVKDQAPHRSRVEIEFELLRLWVGDKIWTDGSGVAGRGEDEFGEREAVTSALSNNHTRVYADYEPAETSSYLTDLEDPAISDISDDEPSPSKLSAFRLDKPASSGRGTRSAPKGLSSAK